MAPGIFIDKTAVSDDGQLRACEAVFDVRCDEIGDQRKGLRADALFLRRPRKNLRIGNIDGDGLLLTGFFIAGFLLTGLPAAGIRDVCQLQRIDAVHGRVRQVCRPDALRDTRCVILMAIYIEIEGRHALPDVKIDGSLPVKELKRVHIVHGKRVIRGAVPVGKGRRALPLCPGHGIDARKRQGFRAFRHILLSRAGSCRQYEKQQNKTEKTNDSIHCDTPSGWIYKPIRNHYSRSAAADTSLRVVIAQSI